MLVLCVLAIASLGFETLASLSAPVREILEYADNGVCMIFLADFLRQLLKAPRRGSYFVRWGWLDLISSIPMVDVFRVGRLVRIIRIVRVLRAFRAAKLLASFLLGRRAEGLFFAATLVTLLLIVCSSIAVLQFEDVPGANITSASDALWWAVTTLTTVGYGDRYPVTGEGRIVATILMTAGIGLFGTFSGFVASWFLKPTEAARENEVEQLRKELAVIRQILERQSESR